MASYLRMGHYILLECSFCSLFHEIQVKTPFSVVRFAVGAALFFKWLVLSQILAAVALFGVLGGIYPSGILGLLYGL
jgi:hypothetical protein